MADDVTATEERQAVETDDQVERVEPVEAAADDDGQDVLEAAMPVEDAEPEPDPEPEPEPEHLDALVERMPHLREQLEERYRERENAGAQRREAQLKREAGSKDVTRRNVEALFRAWGVDDEPDEQGRKRVDYLYDLASANAAMDLAVRYADHLKERYAIPADFREKAVSSREANDFDGYVGHLIEGAVMARIRDIDGAAVPKDSNLYRWMTKERDRMVADELKAKEIEARPKSKAAPPARGSAPAPKTISGTAYAAGTAEDRKRWNAEGYVVVPG